MNKKKKNKNLGFEDILNSHLSQLPDSYIEALLSEVTGKETEEFFARQNIDSQKAELMKRDIAMLLIGIEPYEDFPELLAKDYDLPKEKALAVRDFVNTDLYKSIVKNMKKGADNKSDTMPVPAPPAASDTYAGKTDPYREPAD